MKRRLYNVVFGISLLLFIATALMWLASYSDTFTYEWGKVVDHPSPRPPYVPPLYLRYKSLSLGLGQVAFVSQRWDHIDLPQNMWTLRRPEEPLAQTYWRFSWSNFLETLISFRVKRGGYAGSQWRTIRCPFWPAIVIFGVLPTIRAVKHWKRRRREDRLALGLCAECRYDLRGSPGHCPECGWSETTSDRKGMSASSSPFYPDSPN